MQRLKIQRNLLLTFMIGTIALTLLATTPSLLKPVAANSDRICTTLSPVVAEGVDGNVIIPAGENCVIELSTIKGNVFSEGGNDITISENTIHGNIQIKKATGAIVVESNDVLNLGLIQGNVQIEEQSSGSIRVNNNDIPNANIQLYKNTVVDIKVKHNMLSNGNIQVFTNTATTPYPDGIVITLNYVNGNLQCKENSPAPFAPFNSVTGEYSC